MTILQTLTTLLTVEREAPFSAPETITDMLNKRVRYYQTQKSAIGQPRLESVGKITDVKEYGGAVWVRIKSNNPYLLHKWHIAHGTIIAYIWKAAR